MIDHGETMTNAERIAAGYELRVSPVRRWSCDQHPTEPDTHWCDCEFCERPATSPCCVGQSWVDVVDADGIVVTRQRWVSPFERMMEAQINSAYKTYLEPRYSWLEDEKA